VAAIFFFFLSGILICTGFYVTRRAPLRLLSSLNKLYSFAEYARWRRQDRRPGDVALLHEEKPEFAGSAYGADPCSAVSS
jgi:hypothetical protein